MKFSPSESTMEPLKEMFNVKYVEGLAGLIKGVYPEFKSKDFKEVITKALPELELNQRLRLISKNLGAFLPQDFEESLSILKKVIPSTSGGYTNLVFPDFVGLYGMQHRELSLDALRYFTIYGSSEFAIREFLKEDLSGTLKVMNIWARDKNEHVRRLSSEGSRPRLPWSFKLEAIIQQPELTFPILETLKCDESLYVRKSVANHLNDVSKDHPEKLITLLKDWDKSLSTTAWIVKRACRTLIKKGDPASLSIFNFEKNAQVRILALKLSSKKIRIGEQLEFSFKICSLKKRKQKLVVDYVIHHRGKQGQLLPKVYKLKELELEAMSEVKLLKKHWFKQFSTRKQYAGNQKIDILINGKVMASKRFNLSPA